MAVLAIAAVGTGVGAGAGYVSLGLTIASLFASYAFGGSLKNEFAEKVGLRLESQKVQNSAFGAMQPIVIGVQRVSGNVIWSTDIVSGNEEITAGTVSTKGQPLPIAQTRFFYKASFAIAFGAIPIFRTTKNTSTDESQEEGSEITFTERNEFSGIRRIWANGNTIYDFRTDKDEPIGSELVFTTYLGGEDQPVDPTIKAVEGEGSTPAYKGVCYIVLSDFELTNYGNVLPNISAEVYERLARFEVEEGVEGMALHPDNTVWICCHTQRTLARVNPDTFETIKLVGREESTDPYGHLGALKAHPWRVAVSPTDAFVWVTNRGDGFITKVDPSDNSIAAEYPVSYYPEEIVVDTNNNLWISYPSANKVEKRDSSGSLLATVAIADAPNSLYVHSGGDLFVGGNSAVHRINTSSNSITASIQLSGFFAAGITESSRDSNQLWVAVAGSDVINIINIDTNTIRTVRNTGTLPIGCASNPDDPIGTVYVSTFAGNRLIPYSITKQRMAQFGLISFPSQCLALSDGRVLVCNSKYNIVQLVETR